MPPSGKSRGHVSSNAMCQKRRDVCVHRSVGRAVAPPVRGATHTTPRRPGERCGVWCADGPLGAHLRRGPGYSPTQGRGLPRRTTVLRSPRSINGCGDCLAQGLPFVPVIVTAHHGRLRQAPVDVLTGGSPPARARVRRARVDGIVRSEPTGSAKTLLASRLPSDRAANRVSGVRGSGPSTWPECPRLSIVTGLNHLCCRGREREHGIRETRAVVMSAPP
jgi:hypothetical protein